MGNKWWDTTTNKEIFDGVMEQMIKHATSPTNWHIGPGIYYTMDDVTADEKPPTEETHFNEAIDWILQNRNS